MVGNKVQKSVFEKKRKTTNQSNRTNRTNRTNQTAGAYARDTAIIPDIKVKKKKNAKGTTAWQAFKHKGTKDDAKKRFEQNLKQIGWMPYQDDKIPTQEQTAKQKLARGIVPYWSNLPHFLLDEKYWPREKHIIYSRTGTVVKIVGKPFEHSDQWPEDILKALLKWAKKTEPFTKPGNTPLMADECINNLCGLKFVIGMKRLNPQIAKDSVEYGLTLDDIVVAFEAWCEEHKVELK